MKQYLNGISILLIIWGTAFPILDYVTASVMDYWFVAIGGLLYYMINSVDLFK